MKITLFLLAVLLILAACIDTRGPSGTYTVQQVTKGLKTAASKGIVSSAQADQVASEIASAPTGFDWAALATQVGTVAIALGGAYIGLRPALQSIPNSTILGPEHAKLLDQLVAAQAKAA